MIDYILPLLGLSLLCALWVLFQHWLAKQDPEKESGYKPGCGACSSKSCPEKRNKE